MGARARVAAAALGLCLSLLPACRGRQPGTISTGKLKTTYSIDEIEIQGPTEGRSSRHRVLFIPFGEPKSFLRAERLALEKTDSDILVDRVRYTGTEGLLVPVGEILSWFLPGTPDFNIPLFVKETWYVGGVGAKFRDPSHREVGTEE